MTVKIKHGNKCECVNCTINRLRKERDSLLEGCKESLEELRSWPHRTNADEVGALIASLENRISKTQVTTESSR